MPWATLLVLLPLGGALAMFALPAGRQIPAAVLASVVSAATLALSIAMLGAFDSDRGDLQVVDSLDWLGDAGFSWVVGVDGISVWLVLLTTALFCLAICRSAFAACDRPRMFLGLLLLAEAALLGLWVAGDLVVFYVFWEAMLVPFFFLIGTWGGEGRRFATMQFVVYTVVGSIVMLVAIVATAVLAARHTGQFTFRISELVGVQFTTAEQVWLFAGFALAFAIKLPLWPFHSWMPAAYAAAPIVVTALLAAVMSKAGVYGLLRIGVPVLPEGADRFAVPLMILAVIGIGYGSLVAWRAETMRELIAYSSLAHLGFIVLGIMAFDVQASQGAILQMVNHGVVVAAAFGIVALIARANPSERLDRVSGLGQGAPWLGGVFLVVTMAALALPGSNSFVGEFLILAGTWRHHAWAAILASIGILYAAVYMLRLYQGAMNGPREGDGRRAEIGLGDALTLLPILAVMVVIALWPKGVIDPTEAAVKQAVAPAQKAADRREIAAPVPVNPPPGSNLPIDGTAP